ncbi:MAG: glycosyltransferase [Ignavibacteria bacterium]|nr:glycosyltransferase [Ignavibacteria bacterium]
MNKKEPKVSVLMPVFNGEKYLKKAIESVLCQTYTDFEFIIIDDGSTDNSLGIIQLFNDTRIKTFKNQSNCGIIDTLNFGLELIRGKYIARMDCDDISLPDRLQRQITYLEEHPDVGVVGCHVEIVDSQLKPIANPPRPIYNNHLKWRLIYDCPLMHPSVVFRKELITKYGGYSKQFIHAEDFELWARLVDKTNFYQLNATLLLLRKHEENIGTVHYELQKRTHLEIVESNIESLLCGYGKINVEAISKAMIGKYELKEQINYVQNVFRIYLCFFKKHKPSDEENNQIMTDISIIYKNIFKNLPTIRRIYYIFYFTFKIVSLNRFFVTQSTYLFTQLIKRRILLWMV